MRYRDFQGVEMTESDKKKIFVQWATFCFCVHDHRCSVQSIIPYVGKTKIVTFNYNFIMKFTFFVHIHSSLTRAQVAIKRLIKITDNGKKIIALFLLIALPCSHCSHISPFWSWYCKKSFDLYFP